MLATRSARSDSEILSWCVPTIRMGTGVRAYDEEMRGEVGGDTMVVELGENDEEKKFFMKVGEVGLIGEGVR